MKKGRRNFLILQIIQGFLWLMKNELIECYIRQHDRFQKEYERTLYEKLKTCEIIARVEKKGYNRVAVCVGDDLGENVYQH